MYSDLAVVTTIMLVMNQASATTPEPRQECQAGFTACQITENYGAVPSTGAALAPLYGDLLDSIKGITLHRKSSDHGGDNPSLCCASDTSCLTLASFNVPFCYDRFTTNYVLASGATGTLDNGAYNATDGSSANLITGQYTAADGSTGNIYGNSPPDTATISIPSPYTSAGIGSAIPITALAGYATWTITIPGTTVNPTVFAATTISPVIVSGATINSASTAVTTFPGTTVAAKTSVIVSRIAGTTATSTGNAAVFAAPSQVAGVGMGAIGLLVVAMML